MYNESVEVIAKKIRKSINNLNEPLGTIHMLLRTESPKYPAFKSEDIETMREAKRLIAEAEHLLARLDLTPDLPEIKIVK